MIVPGIVGTVAAQLLEDTGKVALENEWLRVVLDPADAASASSIQFKPGGKEMAVCISYNDKHFKAFREALNVERVREARLDACQGEAFSLTHLEATATAACAVFEGRPLPPNEAASAERRAYEAMRLVKTYRLPAGASHIEVRLRVHNESDRDLPLALWVLNGLRITGEDVDCYAPSPRGIVARPDEWNKGASGFLFVPQAAAPWTGAVARDAAHTGMAVVAEPGCVDSIHNWLAKFNGYTLGFGTPLRHVPAGGVYALDYAFAAHRGLPRLDAVSPHLACAIEFDAGTVEGTGHADIRVHAAACHNTSATLSAALRQLPDGASRPLGTARLELAPGRATTRTFCADLPTAPGTYVVSVRLTGADAVGTLDAERPLVVGDSAERYQTVVPKLVGEPYWSTLADEPLPAWTQECERDVRFPMIPWNTPAAGVPLRMLAVGRVGHTTGVIRDLARRAGVDWELINLHGLAATGGFRRKGDDDGLYGMTETRRVLERLAAEPPDVMLTVGIQYENVCDALLDALLETVAAGMGLVMIWEPGTLGRGPWPALLKRPGFARVEVDLAGVLRSLFVADIAPPALGDAVCYRHGAGRIVTITKDRAMPAADCSRNDLLPQVRGRTRLPDWEYHFAHIVRAIRFAGARAEDAPRIVGIAVDASAVYLTCENDAPAARVVSIAVDIVSTDLLRVERLCQPRCLEPGRHTLTVPTPERPASEVVVHAWLLDGAHDEPHRIHTRGADALFRDAQPLPVLDFQASVAEAPGSVRIAALEVVNASAPVPNAVRARLVCAPACGLRTLVVTAEIRNGEFERVVWRAQATAEFDATATETVVEFQPGGYAPVRPESLLAVSVHDGDRCLARRGQPFRARIVGNVAEDDVAFLTTTGTQADWYAPRIAEPWAVDEAGFDPLFYRHGELNGGLFSTRGTAFPWKRGTDNTLSPPVVDESRLRTGLAAHLRDTFEGLGTTYFCMSDEFRLGGEYDWSPATVAAFRAHLRDAYGTVAALNAEWQRDFASFADVAPLPLAEIRHTPGNLAPWLDFRLFMDRCVNRRIEVAAEEAARVSPLLRVGESGMYAPAYDVAVNYYAVGCASRFMMTYSGLRAAWTRAFLRPDAIAGTWLGYGWQQPHHPWSVLFNGYRILAWWGLLPADGLAHMAVLRPDLTPAHNYRAIGAVQREIRRGIGKLFAHAQCAVAHAFIPYSQVSAYTANALDRNYVDASSTVANLLEREGISTSFIADEQAGRGEVIDALHEAALFFPGIDAMPEAAAAAYAHAIARGCTALADAEVAWRDGHGRRRAVAGRLEAAFGITREAAGTVNRPADEPIDWTAAAPPTLRAAEARMTRALNGLAATDGAVWAQFADGTPAIVARTAATGGIAVWLNTRLEWSTARPAKRAARPEDRPDELSANETVAALVRMVLGRAGIGPAVSVAPRARRPVQVAAFENGRSRLYGLVLGGGTGEAQVRLPATAHTYDSRAGRYLGEVGSFTDRFDETHLAKVYAQLPYRVAGIAATPDGAESAPGRIVRITGRVLAESGAASEFHVVHAEVTTPAGARPAYYAKNLAAPAGAFALDIPLALNAEPGRWQVELRDAATGTTATVAFEVAAALDNT